MPHGKPLIFSLIVRPLEYGSSEILKLNPKVFLIPSRKCLATTLRLNEYSTNPRYSRHSCPLSKDVNLLK